MAWARELGARFKCTYWDKAFGFITRCVTPRLPRAYVISVLVKQGVRRLCVGRSSRMVRYTFNARRGAVHDRCRDRLPLRRASIQASSEEKEERRTLLRLCRLWRRQTQRSSDERRLSPPLRDRERIPTIASSARAHPIATHGLRLLLIGLALILVNLYVLVRARWAIVTRYGSRIYRRAVTLSEVATALLVQIQSLLGFSPEFYCRARGPGSRFIS